MLRIALMVDTLSVDAWIHRIIEDIRKSGFADVVFIVENTPEPPKPKRSKWALVKAHWKRTLYARYVAWMHQGRSLKAMRPHKKTFDTSGRRTAALRVEPIRKGFTDRFCEEDLERIRAAKLDVLFRFGFRIIRQSDTEHSAVRRDAILSSRRQSRVSRRNSHLFWEIYENNPVSGSILQILTDSLDGGRVIYRSHSSTNLTSLAGNRQTLSLGRPRNSLSADSTICIQRVWALLEALSTYNEKNTFTTAEFIAFPILRRCSIFLPDKS